MFQIAIDGKGYDTQALHLDGASGKVYPFLWSKKHSRYLHAPESQEATDDIFKTMNPESLFFFSVVVDDIPGAASSSAPAVKRPGPTLEPRYYQDLDSQELALLAKDCGIPQGINSTQDQSVTEEERRRETWKRVLDGYYLGAGWKAANPRAEQPAAPSPSPAVAEDVTKVIQFPLTEHDELRVIEYCQAHRDRLQREQPSLFARSTPKTPGGKKPIAVSNHPKRPKRAAAPATSEPAAAATG